jgi:hypothetical protein
MSGMKITDMGGMPHTSDMAMKSKTHLKEFHSAEGAGHVGTAYPDTTEQIREDQMKGEAKAKAHPMKPGYRY